MYSKTSGNQYNVIILNTRSLWQNWSLSLRYRLLLLCFSNATSLVSSRLFYWLFLFWPHSIGILGLLFFSIFIFLVIFSLTALKTIFTHNSQSSISPAQTSLVVPKFYYISYLTSQTHHVQKMSSWSSHTKSSPTQLMPTP